MKTTIYFNAFLEYYSRAKMMQENRFNKTHHTKEEINCPLILNVPIYDNVFRRYAGFSNILEDLWYGIVSPKGKGLKEYDQLHRLWSFEVFTFVFLIHRITGSGASFEFDHGYRNSIIPKLVAFDDCHEMIDYIFYYDKPMFTSIGNQIPPFPKPQGKYEKGGKMYLCEFALKLNNDFWQFLREQDQPISIREGVNFCLNWHKEHGLKQFHFVLTAWVMDFAEYFPQYIDRKGPIYVGKNALECLKLLFEEKPNLKNQIEMMNILCEKTDWFSNPYDMEDVCCDFIRYIEEYQRPEHIKKNGIMRNNSILKQILGHDYYLKIKPYVPL